MSNSSQQRFIGVALLGIVLSCQVGCGNKFGATVQGVVNLDGEPLPTGRVTFARLGSTDAPAMSDISSDGSFSLATNREIGVVPGEYRVAIQSFKPIEGLAPGERSFASPEPLVPQRYLSVETSGLTRTVEPGSNRIDLDLTSDGS